MGASAGRRTLAVFRRAFCAPDDSNRAILPGLTPLQAPQSARREDDGEDRSHAEREERPDEEEGSAGLGDAAADADTLSHHVDDGDARTKERPNQDDDVPRSPFGKHQRSIEPDDQD